ncbi:unnamed protein product [Bemisia tabaci]|uniref:Uncharacterized protein n=1 Tax=Bemisia tabaci TaxID=7038 RepID=A0A9P0F130_BEMTA|nr:unnamed protein product [Bemisia tabaci]
MSADRITPLHEPQLNAAVRSGNLKAVKTLVSKGRDLRNIDNRGYTCLHIAAISSDRSKCLLYLLNKAKYIMNEKTYEGETPLLVACENNNFTAVQMLLNAGCDPNISNNEGITPLHYTCAVGNTKIANLLISHGALLDVQDFNEYTPLHEAVSCESLEICGLLLANGASMTIKERHGRTPFDMACGRQNVRLVSLLFEHTSDINSRDVWQITPLMSATQSGSYEVAKFLIDHGANPNLYDSDRVLPIHLAAHANKPKLLELMMSVTSVDVVEDNCTRTRVQNFRSSRSCYRSLPCLAVDAQCLEGLKLILNSNYSTEVKTCPYVDPNKNPVFVSPFSLCVKKIVQSGLSPHFLDAFLEVEYDVNFVWDDPTPVLSPLCAALTTRRLQDVRYVLSILQKLIDTGIDVDYCGTSFETLHEVNCNYGCKRTASRQLPDVFKFALMIGVWDILFFLLKKSCIVEPYLLLECVSEYQKCSHHNLYIDHFEVLGPMFLWKISPCFSLEHPSWPLKSVPSLLILARDAVRKFLHQVTADEPKCFFSQLEQLKVPIVLKQFIKFEQ